MLLLWGALFDLVKIELFSDLFSESLFVYVVTGGAAGFGIAVGRDSQRVIGTLRSITLAIFRTLLPLTSFVALLFIATLPFTGLDPLWETGHASPILLSWIALTVLFLNAVYQDGSGGPPYPRALVRLVEAFIVSMVLYAAISLYGMGLRIGQYGLTVSRFYALLCGAVLGLYAVGYAAAVLRRGPEWLAGVRRVNLIMALVVVALGLLLRRVAAASRTRNGSVGIPGPIPVRGQGREAGSGQHPRCHSRVPDRGPAVTLLGPGHRRATLPSEAAVSRPHSQPR